MTNEQRATPGMKDLAGLAQRVEAASGPSIGLDHEIGKALAGPSGNYAVRPYTASMDAAMTLYVELPERIPSNPRLAVAEALRARTQGA